MSNKLLEIAKNNFEKHYNNKQYQQWRKNAKIAFNFYDGNQLTEQEKNLYLKNSQVPVVINKIKPKIDNIAAMEIKSRTKIKFKSRSGQEDEDQVALAISDLVYYQQDKEDSSYKLSQVANYSRICGIGWHIFEPKENEILEYVGDPFDFIWDSSDKSLDLSESRFICKMTWLDKESASNFFPEHKIEILNLFANKEVNYNNFIDIDSDFDGRYIDYVNNRILVVEYQYKQTSNLYEVIINDNKIIQTTSYDRALKLTNDRSKISLKKGYKLYSTYFSGDIFLSNIEHQYQFDPKKGTFLYTPYILQREITTGVPYGLVRSAIIPQQLYNKKSSKLLWLMSSRQIISESTVTDNWEELIYQASKPDGILLTKSGKLNSIKFRDNHIEISTHFRSLLQHDKEIQDVIGVYDESLGMQTNAKTGIAIKQRQLASVNNHIIPIDRFRAMKRKYGLKLLDLIRVIYSKPMIIDIIDDSERSKQIMINDDLSEDGSIKNNIQVGKYDLYLEEVPDNSNQIEEGKEKIFELLRSKIPITKGTLELFGIPKSMKIYEEIINEENYE